MENLTLVNILLAFLGIFIFTAWKFKKRRNKASFQLVRWFQENIIDVLLAIASTLAILIMADEIAPMLHISTDSEGYTGGLKLLSFFAGISNQSVIYWASRKLQGKLKE